MKIIAVDGFTVDPEIQHWSAFETLGHLMVHDRTMPQEVLARCREAEVLLTNKVKFQREHFEQLPQLRYLGVLSTGTNVVDIKAASDHGVVVTNVPAYSTDSVAQLVMSYILHFSFKVAKHHERVQAGDWVRCQDFSFTCGPLTEIKGKTLGIIGLGHIGQKVAALGQAFGMKVLGYSRSPKNISGIDFVSLAKLLQESDFISLHCPLNADTESIICKQSLDQMKCSAILINTGRGPLVHEVDLAEALNSGRIAGAACDVLSCEPPLANNPLLSARNCVITPHIAWATVEARARLLAIASGNLKCFLEGQPKNVVNG